MKVSRKQSRICGIPLGDICEPNTNTATAGVDPERGGEVSKRSRDFIILFLTRMFVHGCDRNRGGLSEAAANTKCAEGRKSEPP